MLICVGRLSQRRRLDILLSAMSLLKRAGYECNLLVVGDGSEKSVLECMAQELNLPVVFTGECHDEYDLCRYFMAANVTVIPGATGLTAIHSLAYGTPVITNDNFDEQGPEIEAISQESQATFSIKKMPAH